MPYIGNQPLPSLGSGLSGSDITGGTITSIDIATKYFTVSFQMKL